MGTDNYIIPSNSGGGSGGTPDQQPSTPGFWNNNGVPTFFDGQTNNPLDFNEGQQTSRFGTPLGDI